MSKSIEQIAADCGLSGFTVEILKVAMAEITNEPLYAMKDEVIRALYRRIEKLEENREMVVETDGCKITARVESHGIVMQIEHNGIDVVEKLGEVLLESFEGVRQVHVYYGHSDQPDQSIELDNSGGN